MIDPLAQLIFALMAGFACIIAAIGYAEGKSRNRHDTRFNSRRANTAQPIAGEGAHGND